MSTFQPASPQASSAASEPRTSSRRQVLASAAVFSIVPAHVLGGQHGKAPSDKLRIAGVGVGAMGASYLRGCESEDIITLCDVDDAFAAKTFQKYPKAKTYRDYRVMLEKEKGIEGVIIGTPDHTHAVIAAAAMGLGKHVYCAKPLTRTIAECRALTELARKKRVATQMSVQSSATDGARQTEEWIQAGAVGAVHTVHVWTDRPVWPQGLARPAKGMEIPKNLDWDLWLGPAAERPYHVAYHPFVWRGWYDFGTGALGDMACHGFHVPFRALKLSQPTRVSASATRVVRQQLQNNNGSLSLRNAVQDLPETYPHSSVVTWDFPQRGDLPALQLHWYDGGLKPTLPPNVPSLVLPTSGALYVGDQGVLLSGLTGGDNKLFPEARAKSFAPPAATLPRTEGHYMEWINAAKGGPAATCEFGFGSQLTECALLGAIAQRTGKTLDWDPVRMRFPNDPEASTLLNPPYRKGWKL